MVPSFGLYKFSTVSRYYFKHFDSFRIRKVGAFSAPLAHTRWSSDSPTTLVLNLTPISKRKVFIYFWNFFLIFSLKLKKTVSMFPVINAPRLNQHMPRWSKDNKSTSLIFWWSPWHWLSWCPQVGFEGLDSVSWQFSSAICQRAWDSFCTCVWLTTMAPLSHSCCAQASSRVTVPLSLSRCESISPPVSELAV